mgnify:CR=1 FL=1
MAKREVMLERQRKRLDRAKQDLSDATTSDGRRIAKARIAQHTMNILRMEGRALPASTRHRFGSVSSGAGKDFYSSAPWRQLRYRVLAAKERRCVCCGATPQTGAQMHVDHIKPRSTHPELALDASNLQVLCKECNLGKMNFDDTDFR